jgi:hypothetical protein
MESYVTLYDFGNEMFNFVPIAVAAAVAVAGFAIYKLVARAVRKPKRGGPWLQRRTMAMYAGILMMLASITVLVVSLAFELVEYVGTRSAYAEELVTVEGAVAELPPTVIEAGPDAGIEEQEVPRHGFAVGAVEFVFVETGVRYGYAGDADGRPPKAGTAARVGYYDRKGVNVILKLEVKK